MALAFLAQTWERTSVVSRRGVIVSKESVQTVLGPIPADELGRTHMHEHLLVDIYPTRWGYDHVLDDEDVAAGELGCYRAAGGGALVELSPRGAGRDPRRLRLISQRTGIAVVMGTGFLWGNYEAGDGYIIRSCSANGLAEMMIRDLTEGCGDTQIAAGVIGEIGCGASRQSEGRNFISPEEERLLRAAARAHKATGALICTDTFHGELAMEQLEILVSEGVNPSRVVVGHVGDRRDLTTLKRIAQTGANLGFDHVGMLQYAPDTARARLIQTLIEMGHEERIVLSMDVHRRSSLHMMGGIGYDYLLICFVPLMLGIGISSSSVNAMLVENPMRLLPFSW